MQFRFGEARAAARTWRRIAGLGAGLALALAMGFSATPARAAGNAPEGATGIWTFEGEEPLQGTGSNASFKIEQVANPNGTVKVADSGLASLGNSLSFTDKSAAHDIRVRGAITQQQDFTVSFWVKDADDAAPAAGTRTILLHSAGQQASILTEWKDGTFSSSIDKADSNIQLGKNPSRASWQHVTLVKQVTGNGTNKSIKLYLNGSELGSGTWSSSLPAGAIGLVLGSWGTDASQPNKTERFQGMMDELRIYNKALSTDEARALYDSYGDVTDELASLNAKKDLARLVERAEGILAESDGSAVYTELERALDEANRALEGDDADAMLAAKDALQAAIDAVGTTVTVATEDVVRAIDNTIFGINHRYAFNGYGSFDSKTMQVKPDFQKLYEEAGFGSIRYPGGTISNLFNWKETIDWADGAARPTSERTPQIHGFYNYSGQGGIPANFGLKEIGDFAGDVDSEIVYVYALARGNARDAADLVEFLNAEPGTNPNGGTAWADVRAELGHDAPYDVRYFELGNEMNQGGADGSGSQQYWTGFAPNGAMEGYIEGATVTFTKQNAVVRGDWNDTASISDGSAGQEFGMRYANVELDRQADDYDDFTAINIAGDDSIQVFVNGEKWQRVERLDDQAADAKVYVLDEKTGFFTFGGGGHGKAPDKGSRVQVSYSVKRDGFVDIADSMRATMDQINADRAAAGKAAGEMHIYSSFDTMGFIDAMHNKGYDQKYDGLTIHPYSGNPGNDGNPEAYYLEAMRLGDGTVEHVREKAERMSGYADHLVPVISEYGIYNSTNQIVRSQAHALYIVRCIMEYAELGSPYIQKHCLVDWYSDGRDALGPTQQAVIQAVPVEGSGDKKTGEGEFKFFKTPSASAFEMLNSTFGTKLVETSAANTPELKNGVEQLHFAASTDDEGNAYVSIVNLAPGTEPDAPGTNGSQEKDLVRIKLDGIDLTGRTLQVTTLAGDSFDAQNTLEEPDAVPIVSFEATSDAPAFALELEPHSFTIVKVLAEQKPDPEPEPVVKHTVTFVADGETFSTVEVEDGKTVSRPQDEPAKNGYTFKGWMLDGSPFDFSLAITDDLTLQASFKKTGSEGPDGGDQGNKPTAPEDGESVKPGDKPDGTPAKPGDLPQTGDAAGLALLAAAAAPALVLAGSRMKRRS